ncbi:MAG: FAD-dependent monooxygenase [Gammaproteobacteria bacterium]|jgi:2-polyprenyl-6-methoxyphenol hydroxylase-like FAD-dependent oxidoreductase
MKKDSRILIHGAGVAGLTCAIWLGRNGFRPVVVEKTPEIRAAGGFIICLCGSSYRFAKELGMMPALQERDSDIYASSYHNANGNTLMSLDYTNLFNGVDFIQITRDEIENVLYENAKNLAEYRFSTSVKELKQKDSDKVQVEFSDGKQEEYDLVIGTDGLHSTIRGLVFDQNEVIKHYLGLQVAAYKLEDVVGLENKFEYHMGKNNYMVLYSSRDGKLGSVFVWGSDDKVAPPVEERWNILRDNYRDTSPLFQKVIDNYPNTSPMLMDPLIQIEMKKWHKGRVVVLGDAAHCMTLLSGHGASSAFSDASYLSKGLIEGEPTEAFNYYETQMRKSISEMQVATRKAAGWYVPKNALKQYARDFGMKLLPDAFFQNYFKAKYSKV